MRERGKLKRLNEEEREGGVRLKKKRERDGFLGQIELGLGFLFFYFCEGGCLDQIKWRGIKLFCHLKDSLSIIMSFFYQSFCSNKTRGRFDKL